MGWMLRGRTPPPALNCATPARTAITGERYVLSVEHRGVHEDASTVPVSVREPRIYITDMCCRVSRIRIDSEREPEAVRLSCLRSENRLDRPAAPHRPVAPKRPAAPQIKVPTEKTIEARPPALVATGQSRKPEYSFRPYSVVRIGPAMFTNPDESSGAELDTPAAEGLQGLALGVDINRNWSMEFAAEFTETQLLQPGTGEKIGEYGMWSLLGQVRLRYPMWRDRLVPYFLLGAGIGFAEMNDRNFLNAGGVSGRPAIDVNGPLDTTFVGTVGAGLEYFVSDNIALGAEIRNQAFFPCRNRNRGGRAAILGGHVVRGRHAWSAHPFRPASRIARDGRHVVAGG